MILFCDLVYMYVHNICEEMFGSCMSWFFMVRSETKRLPTFVTDP